MRGDASASRRRTELKADEQARALGIARPRTRRRGIRSYSDRGIGAGAIVTAFELDHARSKDFFRIR